MFVEAILTAFIVSIDGFFSGFAVGVKKTKISIDKLIIISIIPILMAIPIMFLGSLIKGFICQKVANYIGFILFVFLAINSLVQIKKDNNEDNVNIITSIIIGITIGIDSSISAFSLALNNHNPIITPFYFGISHGLLIFLGNYLARMKKILKLDFLKYSSPILFTLIAIFKII
ncbi:MAG: manganese efflux pump [bacterium]|nr:manganese efflux pump [bacterium]